MKHSAFGLIELLVTLCIVSILISLTLPTFGSALSRSRSSKCQSNLRQIGIAMSNYLADNDQVYPLAYGVGTPPQSTTWMQKLAPYVGIGDNVLGSAPLLRSTGILNCPAYRPTGRLVSYAMNVNITDSRWNFRALRTPDASTFLIVEINANAEFFLPGGTSDVSRRHPFSSANFLFVDGHVENINTTVPASDNRWYPQ